jgi:hypothetical protein
MRPLRTVYFVLRKGSWTVDSIETSKQTSITHYALRITHFEWVVRRELLWLALLAPFFLFPDRRWALVLAALPTLWIARRIARGRFLPRTPLDWPIALLVVMVLVSLFATFSVEYSLGKVLGLLFGVALYYALVEWADTDQSMSLRTIIGPKAHLVATGDRMNTGSPQGRASELATPEFRVARVPGKDQGEEPKLATILVGFLTGGVALSIAGLLGTNWFLLRAPEGTPYSGKLNVSLGLPRLVSGLPGAENGFHPNEVAGALLWVALPAVALALWALRPRTEGQAMRTESDLPLLTPSWLRQFIPRVPEHSALNTQHFRSTALGWLLPSCFIILTFLALGTLALTESRSAILGACVGLLLLTYLMLPKVRLWLALGVASLCSGVVALGLITLIVGRGQCAAGSSWSGSRDVLLTAYCSLPATCCLLEPSVLGYPTSDPANVRVRLDIWASALAAIKDAPITGIGMNTFRQIMPERYPSTLIPPDFDVAHAHNIFLQTALDLGLPGMLAYIAIWAITAILLMRAWRHLGGDPVSRDSWKRALTAGIGAALLAFLIFGINDAIALGAKPGAFFWALLAIAVLLWKRPGGDLVSAHQGSRRK